MATRADAKKALDELRSMVDRKCGAPLVVAVRTHGVDGETRPVGIHRVQGRITVVLAGDPIADEQLMARAYGQCPGSLWIGGDASPELL